MATAVEQLTNLIEARDRHAIPPEVLLPVQIAAAQERLAGHGKSIDLLAKRIEETGTKGIDEPADLVPLLFAHTAYKSYPESWLAKERWGLLAQWLDTVGANRIGDFDSSGIAGIDDWIVRLAERGQFVSCSSGTSGKVSMIPSSQEDRHLNSRNLAFSLSWSTGIQAKGDYQVFICNPSSNNFRYLDSWSKLIDTFGNTANAYRLPGEPITVGGVREMVRLRNEINDGSARPEDIGAYEALVASRELAMNGAVQGIAEALVAGRGGKLMLVGMYSLIFKVSQMIREMGYGQADFHPENAMMVSGGLKGTDLPSDYREQILETFNIAPQRAFNMYGMQELNSLFPQCRAGRYHVTPWVLLLPLDEAGDNLAGPLKGELEARAAFFDVSHQARWGGLISGDKIAIDYGRCACGHQGPTIGENISRFADLPGGDKISCSGTIDAYVRGVS